MSTIPHPERLGLVLPVEQKLEIAQGVIARLSTEDYQLVTFGSLARGDATPRSDIDICVTPSEDSEFLYHYNLKCEVEREMEKQGVETTFIEAASRRFDQKDGEPYGDGVSRSPTTYDHFGFLSKDPRFDSELRRRYGVIQADVRRYSRTDKQARLSDLRAYINYAIDTVHEASLYRLATRWRDSADFLQTLGNLENMPYHALRKLAGLAKTLKTGDGKAELFSCFANPRIPFFAQIVAAFQPVYLFGQECEESLRLARSKGLVHQYNSFLDGQLQPMVKAVSEVVYLFRDHFADRKILESVSDYDRTALKKPIVGGPFKKWLKEWKGEQKPCQIAWWSIGEEVYINSPACAFIEWNDSKGKYHYERIWYPPNCWFGDGKLKKELVTIEGRFEIDFSVNPPTFETVRVLPTQPEHQSQADIALKSALAKVRKLIPNNVIFSPSL